jgi:hypothetical protein
VRLKLSFVRTAYALGSRPEAERHFIASPVQALILYRLLARRIRPYRQELVRQGRLKSYPEMLRAFLTEAFL